MVGRDQSVVWVCPERLQGVHFYELLRTVIMLHLTLSLTAQIAWISKGHLLKKSFSATYTFLHIEK
jgi:hypothetical protein